MKLKILLSLIILTTFIFWAPHLIDFRSVWSLLIKFPKDRILLLCFLSLLISILKAWRFSVLLKKNRISITFPQMLKVYLAGQATTPLPGGEALRALLLKKETGIKPKDASAAIIIQAALIFVASAFVAIIGSFYYKIFINLAVIAAIILIIGFYFVNTTTWRNYLISLMKKIYFIKSYAETFRDVFEDIQYSLAHENNGKFPSLAFVKSFGVGIIINIIGGGMIYLIITALGENVNFIKSIYIYALSVIINIVSGVVPGGIGLTESGMTGLLIYLHYPTSTSATTVLIYRFATLIFYILVGVFFFSIFYMKDFLTHKK